MTWLVLLILTYWVSFSDKMGSSQIALSNQAIQMREQQEIAIDSLDYAVSPIYIDSLCAVGATICHTSRWMNGATVIMSDSLAQQVRTWSFVSSVEQTYRASQRTAAPERQMQEMLFANLMETDDQLSLINLPALHEAGYKGQGITMAVIDNGFPGVDTMRCFQTLIDENRLLGTVDYTIENLSLTSLQNVHGTNCSMLIAGQTSQYCGAAPLVSLYMIRTEETLTESPKEIDNWVAAVEFCDSVGVQLISTSLGYFDFDAPFTDMTYAQLNGRTMRNSRAAVIAARKGMLICVSNGNEGTHTSTWHWSCTPADADSILTVGAVSKDSVISSFSSWGNTSDGRIKPDVCAMGQSCALYEVATGNIIHGNGTSYSCPLIAGMAACIWSAHPQETAQQIRQRILASCDRYTAPQIKYGYGIPDAYEAAGCPVITQDAKVTNTSPSVRKILYHGQIYIERNGERIHMLGTKMVVW